MRKFLKIYYRIHREFSSKVGLNIILHLILFFPPFLFQVEPLLLQRLSNFNVDFSPQLKDFCIYSYYFYAYDSVDLVIPFIYYAADRQVYKEMHPLRYFPPAFCDIIGTLMASPGTAYNKQTTAATSNRPCSLCASKEGRQSRFFGHKNFS